MNAADQYPITPGMWIRTEENEKLLFLRYSSTGHWGFFSEDSYFERRKGRAMWKLRYFANATRLLFKGNIRWVIYRKALREWPIAVAGKGGVYQLDPDFSDR
ncbi:MAG: hypothetical protein AB7D33_07770 [Sphingobium sp.]|jgi:hypothetical protein